MKDDGARGSVPADHLSPLERAKASHRPMRCLDEFMGITERVKVEPHHLAVRARLTQQEDG